MTPRRALALAGIVAALAAVGGVLGTTAASLKDSSGSRANVISSAATFASVALSVPDIQQVAQVNERLFGQPAQVTGTVTSTTYQWLRGTTPIAGATSLVYQVSALDVGQVLRLRAVVVTTNGTVTTTSEPTQVVKTGGPSITGGSTSSVDNQQPGYTSTGAPAVGTAYALFQGNWSSGSTITQQWLRCDATGAACVPISGATGTSYVPVAADRGLRLRVRVTATRLGISSSTETADTAVVQ